MSNSLPPGARLNNRYRILRLLGQGGMGAVYLAEDENLPGRQVAVKENLDLAQNARDQFKREATILARLKHPHLPQVTDHFVLPSGAQYLVMDYVAGEDLDQVLARRGPLPAAEALSWMTQVFDAVEYMHTWVDPTTGQALPVIHRDIKPGNIKLTPQGQIVLVDFGIAKYQTGGGTLTGARAASPGFSPVEQYTGGTDVRSDVYALGATLYCLLTGQTPPEAPELAAGRIQLARPRTLAPGLNARTEAAILQAMQLRASNRYQTVRELRQALAGPLQVQVKQQTCASCGAMNKPAAHFCQTCGAALQIVRPFAVKPAAAWCACGALVGLLLAYLPKLALSAASPAADTAIFAGALFFGAAGAAVGAMKARHASLDAPDFLPRFGITFLIALLCSGVSGLLLGNVALGGGFGAGSLGLALLGSAAGGIAGARASETATFRKIRWS